MKRIIYLLVMLFVINTNMHAQTTGYGYLIPGSQNLDLQTSNDLLVEILYFNPTDPNTKTDLIEKHIQFPAGVNQNQEVLNIREKLIEAVIRGNNLSDEATLGEVEDAIRESYERPEVASDYQITSFISKQGQVLYGKGKPHPNGVTVCFKNGKPFRRKRCMNILPQEKNVPVVKDVVLDQEYSNALVNENENSLHLGGLGSSSKAKAKSNIGGDFQQGNITVNNNFPENFGRGDGNGEGGTKIVYVERKRSAWASVRDLAIGTVIGGVGGFLIGRNNPPRGSNTTTTTRTTTPTVKTTKPHVFPQTGADTPVDIIDTDDQPGADDDGNGMFGRSRNRNRNRNGNRDVARRRSDATPSTAIGMFKAANQQRRFKSQSNTASYTDYAYSGSARRNSSGGGRFGGRN